MEVSWGRHRGRIPLRRDWVVQWRWNVAVCCSVVTRPGGGEGGIGACATGLVLRPLGQAPITRARVIKALIDWTV